MQVSPAEWAAVERTLPFLAWLPPDDLPRLRRMALEFLADKEIHGAKGLVVTDAMLLSIALQACLPVLHIGLDAYAGWIGIVVYPGEFMARQDFTDEAGVVHQLRRPLIGEAWERGPVILSWADVLDSETATDGFNAGAAPGVPPRQQEVGRIAGLVGVGARDLQQPFQGGGQ